MTTDNIHTYNGVHEFIEVDLGSQQTLAEIVVTNRDAQYGEGPRLNGAMVVGYDDARVEVYRSAPIAGAGSGDVFSFQLGGMVNARYVAVEHSNQWLHISEIEVFGPDPTGPGGATPTNPYDIGMLATVTDQSGQTDYSNDALRGAFREDLRQMGSAQYSTTYSSDALGQTTQMDYPSGSQLLFNYDSDGDLTGLQWQGYDPVSNTHGPATDVVSGMTYKPMGPLASLSYGDGGLMTASYDTSYRLTGLTDTRAGTTLRDVSYSWTNRNNLGGVTDNLNPNQNELYDYSPREFLASGDGAWGELDWLYDSVGNRTQQMSTISGVSTTDTYSYPPDSNRLTDIAFGAGGLRELTYDAAGNVTFDNRNGPGYGYNYDAAGRMSSFAINGVIQAEYEYNYLGQQVIRRLTQTGQVIHSIHDALGNRIAEYAYDETTGTSTLIREYIWAAGMNVAVVEAGQVYFVRTDHIGRPVFATDTGGTKVWETSYLPFGGVETSTGPNSELRFPGQWFQSETGLHQNWMRDYDPTLGRYLQADPLGLVDGASVYGYVLQNPGRYVDPTGQYGIPIYSLEQVNNAVSNAGHIENGGRGIGSFFRGLARCLLSSCHDSEGPKNVARLIRPAIDDEQYYSCLMTLFGQYVANNKMRMGGRMMGAGGTSIALGGRTRYRDRTRQTARNMSVSSALGFLSMYGDVVHEINRGKLTSPAAGMLALSGQTDYSTDDLSCNCQEVIARYERELKNNYGDYLDRYIDANR